MTVVEVSATDIEFLSIIRHNVETFMKHVALKYVTKDGVLLDIAPQDHAGARPFFSELISIDTFDINPMSGCTYIGDICKYNPVIADDSYDFIVCTEVLEHTLQPFNAVTEIRRLLKPGGLVFISVPFNFRIHGPLPDCWRFTEHGLKVLFSEFHILELESIEAPQRPLMPIQYTMVAQKPD